jgi:kynurenine formamidase
MPKVAWTCWPRRLVDQEEPAVEIKAISTMKEDGVYFSKFAMSTQSFTHMDAPSHYDAKGINNDEVPLETLVGEGVVFDVTYKKPGQGVTADDLEKTGVKIKSGEMAIIRTGWTDDAPWGTERFWTEMIYLDPSVGKWLVKKKVKALVYDCYADPPFLYKSKEGEGYYMKYQGSPNHIILLTHGIPLFTFCRNLRAIKKPRVTIIALPLKLVGTDGAPARIIAIEED